MAKLTHPRPSTLAAALALAVVLPTVAAADSDGKPADQYKEYYRDTSVPQVPAAALLGVDKSKIIEVASVSTFASTLSSAREASSDGTPFGIDIAPYLFLANASVKVADAIKSERYVSDPWVRLMARTRLSYATAQNGNSSMNAWGIYTRPIDLRDPFVDPVLESCRYTFTTDWRNSWKALPADPPEALTKETVDVALVSLRQIFNSESDPVEYREVKVAMDDAESKAKAKTGPDIDQAQIQAWYVKLKTTYLAAKKQFDAGEEGLQATYGKCSKDAVGQLANRSYLAIGYSQGSARGVDDSKPVDLRPGEAWWITFVYGFEGLGNVFGSDANWKRALESGATTASALEGSARLTLHVARNLKSSKRVSDVEQSTAGTLLGLGFDYAFMDSHRVSAQVTQSRIGEGATRSTERRAVVGLDFRIQEGLWFGLSWGRLDSTLSGKQNEAKAAIKWAFSDKSWLPQ